MSTAKSPVERIDVEQMAAVFHFEPQRVIEFLLLDTTQTQDPDTLWFRNYVKSVLTLYPNYPTESSLFNQISEKARIEKDKFDTYLWNIFFGIIAERRYLRQNAPADVS